jgi:hypothetical protein
MAVGESAPESVPGEVAKHDYFIGGGVFLRGAYSRLLGGPDQPTGCRLVLLRQCLSGGGSFVLLWYLFMKHHRVNGSLPGGAYPLERS